MLDALIPWQAQRQHPTKFLITRFPSFSSSGVPTPSIIDYFSIIGKEMY